MPHRRIHPVSNRPWSSEDLGGLNRVEASGVQTLKNVVAVDVDGVEVESLAEYGRQNWDIVVV